MASVVNISTIGSKMIQLGWTSIQVSDVVAGLASAGIPASEFCAYLEALIATPEGMNDQAIAGCPGADATKITNYLKNHQAVTI